MNSGKIFSTFLCACASAQAFAASFLFTGSSDGDLSNYQNYYALSSDNSNDVYSMAIYLYPMDYDGDMKANCPNRRAASAQNTRPPPPCPEPATPYTFIHTGSPKSRATLSLGEAP